MAQGQLPLYYKNSKLVGPGSPRKRWKEYYLLVVLLFGFLMLYVGIGVLPDVEEVNESIFTGPSIVGVSEERSEPSLSKGVVPSNHPVVVEVDKNIIKDPRIIQRKLEQNDLNSHSSEEKAHGLHSSPGVTVMSSEVAEQRRTVPSSQSPSEDTNVNKMRRDKVLQVRVYTRVHAF